MKTNRSDESKKTKVNVYDIITDRVIKALKNGVVPWHKPWKVSCYNGVCGSAFNLKSKRPYRGMNTFILAAADFSSPWWVTKKQVIEMGGRIKHGERKTPVVFWKVLDVEDKKSSSGKKKVPFLRYYPVFNVEQCEGLEDKIPQPDKPADRPAGFTPIDAAEILVAGMPQRPEISHGGDRAFYSPIKDKVTMPEKEAFNSPDHYYSVLFHELGHSTGHEDRLNRKGVSGSDGKWSPFGSPDYVREELVAEMTTAFLCGETGIEGTFENSVGYLEEWRSKLSDDHRMIIYAAQQAQKAADFILGRMRKEATNEDNETVVPTRTEQNEVVAS